MNNGDLEVRADRIRGMVALLDAPAGRGEKRLRSVIQAVEGLARDLLEAGAADPGLKAEIIAWVIRFRAEKALLPALTEQAPKAMATRQPKATKPAASLTTPRAPKTLKPAALHKAQQAPKHPEPFTRTFAYDTTDSRTMRSDFVKKARAPHVKPPSPVRAPAAALGTTPRALRFELKLERLSEDVRRAGKKPRGSADAVLQARILELYQTRLTVLDRVHHDKVGADLEALALILGTALSSFRSRPGSPGYTPVPHELTFTKGGPVVSGGLPTLGRGRR